MGNNVVEYIEGMSYGRGFNRLTGEALPSRAVSGDTARIKNAEGQRVSSSCRITTEVQTLHESLGISVEAGGSYMGFSASAKVDYANQCDFSSFSTYIIVHVTVANAFEDIVDPVFHPDAVELLKNNNTERFRERFGDCFISGLRTGGEYFAIYQLTSTSESKRESLAVDVQAHYNGIIASADLRVKIATARSETSGRVDTRVFVYREGSIRTADITAEDIMETARQFPVEIGEGEAFVYGAMLQDYKTLHSPNDAFDYYEIQARQQALAELAKKRFEFLTLRDDMAFILANIDNFVNADGTDVSKPGLSADYDTVTAQVNDMQDRMSAYSRDASIAELPSYDIAKFTLPVLRKKAGIEVPSFVGLRAVAVEQAMADTLRKYEDYRAAILADAEPGTSGLPMDATQYAFVIGGMSIAWDPPMAQPGPNHYLRWVVGQEPAAGKKATTGDRVTLKWKGGMRFPGPA